jgi:hypothetical protein
MTLQETVAGFIPLSQRAFAARVYRDKVETRISVTDD